MAERNPFDDFADPDPNVPALNEPPPPGLAESFGVNAREGFRGSLFPVIRDLIDARTVEKGKKGTAGVGSSPLDGLPSEEEVSQAQARLNARKREKEAYQTFESDGFVGKAVGLIGGLAGGLVAPENLAGAGGAVARQVASAGARLGLGVGAARIAGAGTEAGLVNALIDIPTQGMEIAAGLEDEYSKLRTAGAFGLGAIAGGGMQAFVEHLARRRLAAMDAEALSKPAPVLPEAVGAPAKPLTATGQATAQFVEPLTGSVEFPDAAKQAIKLQDEAAASPRVVQPQAAIATAPPSPGKPAGVFMFDATKLKVDPERFQFKSETDAEGVSTKLRSVKEWDAAKANQIIVWQATDGSLYVADGHQRTGLARRLSQDGKPIELPGLLYRETDGWKSKDVMVLAAEKNIGEGSGSIVDAAKIVRLRPDVGKNLEGISDYRIRQASDLAGLGDEPWRMVLNEVIDPEQGAMVGRLIRGDEPRQLAAIAAIERFRPANMDETAALVRKVAQSELVKQNERAQSSLFGDDTATSTVIEEIRIAAQAAKLVRSDKALFGRVLNEADRIEAAGSNINRTVAASIKDDAGRIAAYIASQVDTPGPIRDALLKLAREVKDGTRSYADAARSLVEHVRGAHRGDDAARPGAGGRTGGEGPATPVAGVEPTAARNQTLIPGVAPVSERQKLEVQAGKPLTGGNAAPPAGGISDMDARNQVELFSQPVERPALAGAVPAVAGPDAQFPQRRQLSGEDTKARGLPPDATPEGIRNFNVHTAIEEVAGLIGHKVEVDQRQANKRALGVYNTRNGVIRLRYQGDMEVFVHEFGHAADSRLHRNPAWTALTNQHLAELKALDANAANPADQTIEEGIAEFMRMYVNNPAYARNEAPNFFPDFERFVQANDPVLWQTLQRATRLSQIDSGMTPTQAIASTVSPAIEAKGFKKLAKQAKELGGGVRGWSHTLGDVARFIYSGLTGPDNYIRVGLVDPLREAAFANTGRPRPELDWNPTEKFRMIPGAEQAGIDAIYHGTRQYGSVFNRDGPSLYQPLHEAMRGEMWRVEKADDPLFRDFNAYLIARRARALYERWHAGDLQKPPLGRSENEVIRAIADFEVGHPHWQRAGDQIVDWFRAQFQRRFDAGLIPREAFDAVMARGDDYVPFLRDMRDDKADGVLVNSSGSLEKGVSRRIKGSSRNIKSPIHMGMFQAMQIERIIAENDFVKSLAQLAKLGGEFAGKTVEDIPNTKVVATSIDLMEGLRNAGKKAGLSKVDIADMLSMVEDFVGPDATATVFKRAEIGRNGERILFYWDAGERKALKLGKGEWADHAFVAVEKMTTVERDFFLNMMMRANALFSQFVTNIPSFALINLASDTLTRPFIARKTGMLGRIPGASILAGAYANIFEREFVQAYGGMGGIRGGVYSAASRDMADRTAVNMARPMSVKEHIAEVTRIATSPKDAIWEVVKSPITAMKAIVKTVEATETLGRHGQARLVYRHLRNQGVDKETAIRAAVYEARDVMDYDRRGDAVKWFNRYAVFTNPAIQGTDRTWRAMFGALFEAHGQAKARGGWDNIDADVKANYNDALGNLTLLFASAATIPFAHYWMVADDPIYQKQSDYMKRRYWIIPTVDKDGRDHVYTIPKPFDFQGAVFAAIERGLDGLRRQDPRMWAQMRQAFMESAVPRQFSGPSEMLVESNPLVKGIAELKTGQRFGFEGTDSRPIVPDSLARKAPPEQWNEYTSALSKRLGKMFNASPMMLDHAFQAFGATAARDALRLADGVVGNNPNRTFGDALNQVFFGRIYRESPGAGAFGSQFYDLMARDNGKYAQTATSYKEAVERGRLDDADDYYRNATDALKAMMTLRTYARFDPATRGLHPLERTNAILADLQPMLRDLAANRGVLVEKTYKRGEPRQTINIPPAVARSASETIKRMVATEMRNGLAVAGEPGFKQFPIVDTAADLKAIRALSAPLADEIEKRFKKSHVLPVGHVKAVWPEVQKRLLADRDKANLGDLKRPQ